MVAEMERWPMILFGNIDMHFREIITAVTWISWNHFGNNLGNNFGNNFRNPFGNIEMHFREVITAVTWISWNHSKWVHFTKSQNYLLWWSIFWDIFSFHNLTWIHCYLWKGASYDFLPKINISLYCRSSKINHRNTGIQAPQLRKWSLQELSSSDSRLTEPNHIFNDSWLLSDINYQKIWPHRDLS